MPWRCYGRRNRDGTPCLRKRLNAQPEAGGWWSVGSRTHNLVCGVELPLRLSAEPVALCREAEGNVGGGGGGDGALGGSRM
ncbi:hypothetical protein NHX12_033522 [Muraenolepis orangiensis]|uniref:Uncharacterized protein n=1 Tax=Muraenolepis orangiensis TaxID=630683 RepID=A0A9Q0IIR8_9TELE|nr:hypothetical protein NHX12_033522 [Muraenolepis orangiensis]